MDFTVPRFPILVAALAAFSPPYAAAVGIPSPAHTEEFGTLRDSLTESPPPESHSIYHITPPVALFRQPVSPATECTVPEEPDVSGTAFLPPTSPAPEIEIRSQPPIPHSDKHRFKDLKLRTAPDLRDIAAEPWKTYRTHETALLWTPSDDLGWTSLLGSHYLPAARNSGKPSFSFSLHWLNGPTSVPLPPRLYDLSLNYQRRGELTEYLSYDVAASIGLYTDFEDSAREGLRFPSHAVAALHKSQELDIILGADFPDRDDYPILPVFGISLHNTTIRGLRLDLVFPRPRIEYAWDADTRSYISGQLGGGTWDIEMPDSSEDVVTVREYRLAVGTESIDEDGNLAAFEIGWIFNRSLEFRALPGSHDIGETLMLQWVTRRR